MLEERKTFVEWCREYRTPKSDTQEWLRKYLGLDTFASRLQLQNDLDRWNERVQRDIAKARILPVPPRY